ncbi:MAG: hypothetical protein IJ111_04455 [Eggerthellaceae bacterium]|nr:hypothetical protein [Eggerthellaceae bacterium]
MTKAGTPNGKVSLLFTYDVDCDNHVVYSVGVDESGKYYSVEDHEYNIGSAYDFYTDYYVLDDSEIEGLRRKAKARENSEKRIP